ncbi:PQQ-dependent sugar dehydrogenase [Sphingopyxis terrae]|uniref:PQQ-dependent sugar dehydrogenase n=1 Tax=Sphingopyxis terrae TaxID=33052 RepID=UPI003628323B
MLLDDSGQTLADLEGVPEVFASGQSGLFDVLLSPRFETNQQLLPQLRLWYSSAQPYLPGSSHPGRWAFGTGGRDFSGSPRQRGDATMGAAWHGCRMTR